MSEQRERIAFDRTFTPEEFANIRVGRIPQAMEDKWFVFLENGWLYFHRSWTGYCICQVKIVETDTGWQVVEAWVNRDNSPCRLQNAGEDSELLTNVFQWSLGI